MARRKVLLNWQVGCDFGWGILGLNVFSHWARDTEVVPLSGMPIGNQQLGFLDPLRHSAISAAISTSNSHLDSVKANNDGVSYVDGLVIDPVSQSSGPSTFASERKIARCIFENTNIDQFAPRLAHYDDILCASTWNAEIIRRHTGRSVSVIHEGVDHSLFCPGPRSGILDPAKFYIYSGGKIEFRKGQDLVLLAFKEFSKRYANAVLVTAWHSPWPEMAVGFKGLLDEPLELDQFGNLDIKKWVVDNGIDSSRVVELFRLPNQIVPTILREMDVALQPSRAEACTNLPVKEAMACGVPVIVGYNTGMKDLIEEKNCVALYKQAPIGGEGEGLEGWAESDVGEIVEALARLYHDRELRHSIGTSASRFIRSGRTWELHAKRLKELALSL